MDLRLTEILNLPGVVVETFQQTDKDLLLEVEVYAVEATCPRCGNISHNPHQNHWYWVRDLPISGRSVMLKVNRRQFKCKTCRKPFSEDLEFVGKGRKYTHRLAMEIVKQVIHSDVHNVALNNDLSDEEVWSMILYVAEQVIVIDLKELRRLGIDEISLRKGLGQFIVVLVDLDTMKPIGFVKSRKQKDIEEVLRGWGDEVLEQIVEVSIDMSGNYKGLVQKLLANADITVDRFHVMKIVNEELNAARIKVKLAAAQLEDETKKSEIISSLNQSKYVLLKAAENLEEEQQKKLASVQKASPVLAHMYELKEQFRTIFNSAKNWGDGTLKLLDWLAEADSVFQKSTKTIKRWLGEIVGYFERGTTNGVVEGINNKLKLIKRSGFGFRNFENFELRSLICWYFDVRAA